MTETSTLASHLNLESQLSSQVSSQVSSNDEVNDIKINKPPLLESLNTENLVCIAYDINGDSESILTKSIKGWEKINIEFEKKPCIFLVN